MTDLRSRLLAFLDEELAICEKATEGPWKLPDYQRPDWEMQDVPTYGGVVKIPKTLAGFPAVQVTVADAAFIVSARVGYERTLRALKAEVERHEKASGNYWLVEWCSVCPKDKNTYENWPCPFLTRIGAALEIPEDR